MVGMARIDSWHLYWCGLGCEAERGLGRTTTLLRREQLRTSIREWIKKK